MVSLWDVTETGEQRQVFSGHKGAVHSVAFSPDGGTLATGAWDGMVLLWDMKTGEQKQAFGAYGFCL